MASVTQDCFWLQIRENSVDSSLNLKGIDCLLNKKSGGRRLLALVQQFT